MILNKSVFTLLPLLVLPFLAACSDQRANYPIDGSAHTLTMIRVTNFFWDKNAKYFIVPTRMPDCMRKHPMPEAPLAAKAEIFSPGNNAWFIRQNGRLFITETRTCEGFAPVEKEPEDGLGPLVGVFEMRNDTFVFTAAPKVELPPPPVAEPVAEVPVQAPVPAAPVAESPAAPVAAPAPAKN